MYVGIINVDAYLLQTCSSNESVSVLDNLKTLTWITWILHMYTLGTILTWILHKHWVLRFSPNIV
jgi:hypothetical protein